MARQPKQAHIYLFRKNNEQYEFAIFRRSDMPECWQGICGGLEDNESLEEGARREIFEEAGITDFLPLYRLESISYIPDHVFGEKARTHWGKDVVVVPMYFFAMPFDGTIKLSAEHTDVVWLPFEQAHDLIFFKDQQVALYELNERLIRNNLF